MTIREHPDVGSILMCDFDNGFKRPEMIKRRPVVVLSPKIAARPGLCTVVALSTTEPDPVMPYHCQIDITPALPAPLLSKGVWVKGDMIDAVGFHRLDFIRLGKSLTGKRLYRYDVLSAEVIREIRVCALKALGMTILTHHLP